MSKQPRPIPDHVFAFFEHSAAAQPDAPALTGNGTSLTYGELAGKVDQLAAHLQHQGIKPGANVGLCLERSAELITSVLGILKAGAAYVPIDPAYPKDRIALMLQDARPPMVVTDREHAHLFPDNIKLLLIDELDQRTMLTRDILPWPEMNLTEPTDKPKYRFNWTSPTILSAHDPNVLLTGANGIDSGAGVLVQTNSNATILSVLGTGGWTLLTAVNLMLFSLLHNPCSTTIYTIYKESGSKKWTTVAALLPLAMGLVVTFVVAQVWRLLA